MRVSTMVRGVSAGVLGLSLLVGCDSDMSRSGESRTGDTRVAGRAGDPSLTDRPGSIGTTPNSAATPNRSGTAGTVDDAALKTEVKAKLSDQAAAGLSNVNVESNNGVVKLTGVVTRPELKQRATELVKAVDGVRDVINNIEVRGA